MKFDRASARYATVILAAIVLPYMGNRHLWPGASALCLLLVLLYVRGIGAARRGVGKSKTAGTLSVIAAGMIFAPPPTAVRSAARFH